MVVVHGGAVVVGGGGFEVARCACCVWMDGRRVGVRGSSTVATQRTSSTADIATYVRRRGEQSVATGTHVEVNRHIHTR